MIERYYYSLLDGYGVTYENSENKTGYAIFDRLESSRIPVAEAINARIAQLIVNALNQEKV